MGAYPSSLESFGPSGIPWVRNVQIRWMPLRDHSQLTVALEKPGATGYLEVFWSDQWGAVGGLSWVDVDNSEGQSPDAFSTATYASITLRYQAVHNVTLGLEYQ